MNAPREATSHTRYAIYARTAAGGPGAAGAQVAAIHATIAARGDTEVVTVHRDIGASGIGAPGPGLTAMLHDLAAGGIDAVAVTDITRLGRCHTRLADMLAVIERAGARLVCIEGGP